MKGKYEKERERKRVKKWDEEEEEKIDEESNYKKPLLFPQYCFFSPQTYIINLYV